MPCYRECQLVVSDDDDDDDELEVYESRSPVLSAYHDETLFSRVMHISAMHQFIAGRLDSTARTDRRRRA